MKGRGNDGDRCGDQGDDVQDDRARNRDRGRRLGGARGRRWFGLDAGQQGETGLGHTAVAVEPFVGYQSHLTPAPLAATNATMSRNPYMNLLFATRRVIRSVPPLHYEMRNVSITWPRAQMTNGRTSVLSGPLLAGTARKGERHDKEGIKSDSRVLAQESRHSAPFPPSENGRDWFRLADPHREASAQPVSSLSDIRCRAARRSCLHGQPSGQMSLKEDIRRGGGPGEVEWRGRMRGVPGASDWRDALWSMWRSAKGL